MNFLAIGYSDEKEIIRGNVIEMFIIFLNTCNCPIFLTIILISISSKKTALEEKPV